MSYRDCLTRAALRGAISEGKAKEALDLLDEYERELRNSGMADDVAGAQAAEKATAEMRRLATRKKQLAVLAHSAKQRNDADMLTYRNAAGKEDMAAALKNKLENDGTAAYNGYTNKMRTYRGRFHGMLQGFIDEYGKGIGIAMRSTQGLDDVGRELFGMKTGNETASTFAKSISETLEYARTTANSLGADIAKKERYGLPQRHNTLRVAKAGREAWVRKVMPLLDFSLMRDSAGRSMAGLDMEEKLAFVGKVWETIKSNGYIKAADSKGAASLANRLGQRRYLEFRDYDAWKAYNDEFGDGDAFSTIIDHVEDMSRQIAMLDVFGPNPHAMFRYLRDKVANNAGAKDVADAGPASTVAWATTERHLREIDDMWGIATGQNSLLGNDYLGFTMAGIRNLLVSSQLAGATLAAVPGDMVTVRMAKSMSKLPSNDFIKNYAKLVAKSGDRQLAIRLGLIAEAATGLAGAHHRYMGDVFGPAWTRHVSDFVMRVNGMTGHTQAGRWAHGMEWLGYFADARGKAFDELEVVDALKRAGITEDDWKAFKTTPLYEYEGATFLRPDDMLTRQDVPDAKRKAVADKFLTFTLDQMHQAVPDATLRARSFLIGSDAGHALPREILRSFAMYKNFPVTITMQLYRNMMMQQGLSSKLAFAATYGLMLTSMGALTVQMQQIAKGRDPLSMNPASKHGRNFWGMAALTGGGMGIWGDFLFRDTNRYGGNIEQTIAGPVAAFATDAVKLTTGNLIQLAGGEETKFGAELLQFARRYTPGSNLWYGRMVLQNGIFDAIQREVDPDAVSKWQREQSGYYRDYGQQTWWGRGRFTPRRAPDASAIAQ